MRRSTPNVPDTRCSSLSLFFLVSFLSQSSLFLFVLPCSFLRNGMTFTQARRFLDLIANTKNNKKQQNNEKHQTNNDKTNKKHKKHKKHQTTQKHKNHQTQTQTWVRAPGCLYHALFTWIGYRTQHEWVQQHAHVPEWAVLPSLLIVVRQKPKFICFDFC